MIKRQSPGLRIVPDDIRHLSVNKLFSMGYDTMDIAASTARSEAFVYNLLASQRESERSALRIVIPAAE